MYSRYGLVLMVTHACNLRCSYCYTGEKFSRQMPPRVGRRAIDRALASIRDGGTLELGFFGGEPLLEAPLIASLIDYATARAADRHIALTLSITTNGTAAGDDAWAVLMRPELDLAISFDGLPELHDRHRPTVGGQPSSQRVLATIKRLLDAGRAFRVVMVVRPDTVGDLAAGIRFLHGQGVRQIEPSLDLWTTWNPADIDRLQAAIPEAANVWRDGLPHLSVGWFDEKAAHLARVPIGETARCGFGHGEIAVAPSGRLYPCERLIGADAPDDPMVLPGHAMEGDDFLPIPGAASRSHESCDTCEMLGMCNAICRCSNYVRTGDVRTPDWLLCAWNQACLTETARVLNELAVPPVPLEVTHAG